MLHHSHSFGPQLHQELKDIYISFCLDPLHHAIQHNEGASPAYTSTAVDQEGILVGGRVDLIHLLDEVHNRHGIGWYTMIRPGQIVQLGHFQ